MAEGLRITRADRRWAEGLGYVVEVELRNAGAEHVGPGGILMSIETSDGGQVLLSASNHWPLEPGGRVFTSVSLPKERMERLDFVGYAENGGATHPLGSRLVFGWMSSKLVQAEAAPHV